jgi:hypothetical protein
LSVPDAPSERVSPSETRVGVTGRATPTSREKALQRAAEHARSRLNHESETQTRIVIDLHERAGALRELLDGETQTLKAEWEQREEARKWDGWASRKALTEQRGLEVRAHNCRRCGLLRSRPSDPCPKCLHQEGSHGANPADVNRAFGYAQ